MATLGTRAVDRKHTQDLLGRDDGGIERIALLGAGEQVRALQDVVGVVRRHAVCADRAMHAGINHGLHRRKTTRELHVARRVQAHVHALCRHELDVGGLDPHAVRCGDGNIEGT